MYMETIHTPAPTAMFSVEQTKDRVLNEILEVVSAEFGITIEDMMVSCRSHSVWMPRMAAMYFARMLTPISLISLGQIFGGRSHSTVLRAYRRCRNMIEQDESWATRMNRMLARLVERNTLSRAA